jgi:hypothetical protein
MNTHTGIGDLRRRVYPMTTDERTTPDQRHLPDNVVRMDRSERRAPQRWWERAQAGALYGTDEQGNGRVKDTTGTAA